MNNDIVIKVENLSKRYRIGERFAKTTLREFLANILTSPKTLTREKAYIWALKDVSFEVRRGEVIGIIGNNGAGKSTLLKILSHITEPTGGRVVIKGRLSSLLEVGTGFHPELTGRENIYLNGAILGMKKREIEEKFNEIVTFSEIEKFIDTPVKFYSSGMYVRLAFSVSIHLDSEILLVDEVLAVGDLVFQKKCLDKMENFAKSGRTIIFVSHNMGAISSLTNKCIYLRSGRVEMYGDTKEVVERYLNDSLKHSKIGLIDSYRRTLYTDSPVRITKIWVNQYTENFPIIPMGTPLGIYIQTEVYREIVNADLTIILKNLQRVRVVVIFSGDKNFYMHLQPGKYLITLQLENLLLVPDQYFADIIIKQRGQNIPFEHILDYPIFRLINTGEVVHWFDRPWGVIHCNTVQWIATKLK